MARIVSVPGEPGTRADSRIVPDLEWIRQNYRVDLRDAYAATGHAAGGEHPLGLAVDIVPGRGGNWDDVDHLAAYAAQHMNVFRFIGYDGRFGTTAWPNHGRGNHLHLSWRHTGSTLATTGRVPTLVHGKNRTPPANRGRTPTGPAQWLKEGGWPARLWPIAIAIGGAESHWQVDATNTNTNGTTDDGWLQVNSIHGFDRDRLRSDPVYAARAGYAVYKKQGFQAWTTYNTGAYRAFMGKSPGPTFSRPRPGGEPTGESAVDTELAAWFNPLAPTPGDVAGQIGKIPNPLDLFKGASKAVTGTADFFKWIAWIFHPLNILRAVEFNTGLGLLFMGLWILVQEWRGADSEAPFRLIGDVASMTPAGRGVRVAKGVSTGKALARSEARRAETAKAIKSGRKKQTAKQGQKRLAREARKDKEPIPF